MTRIKTRNTLPIVAALLAGVGLSRFAGAEKLDSFGDEKTMSALADRGLDTLLNQMFEEKQTPESQREGIRALRAMRELADPSAHLTNSKRQALLKTVVGGLNSLLPTLNDPDSLMKYAGTLMELGVEPEVNNIEYWGHNSVTEARLKPVITTVLAIFDRVRTTARAKADDLANKLAINDPRADLWQHLDDTANAGEYQGHLQAYALILATDPSTPGGMQARKKLAAATITYLSGLDNPDSTVMPVVRLAMAKIDLAIGNFADAHGIFDSLIQNPGGKTVVPAPDVSQQYEARYFDLVAQLENKNLEGATEGLEKLIAWQKAKLPHDKATQSGVAAAAEILRYRIESARAQQATDPSEREAANNKAMDILTQLMKDHPEFTANIIEQFMTHVTPDQSVTTLNPFILQGLMQKGGVEAHKTDAERPDFKVIDRAINAAHEVITRKDRTGISLALTQQSMLLIGDLEDREGKPLKAANAYLDFVEKFQDSEPAEAKQAVDSAGYEIFVVAKKLHQSDNPEMGPLFDRFLPIAIAPPYNHKDLAYTYGRRLRDIKKYAEAVHYFQLVPATDHEYLAANYYEMLALRDMLDTKLTQAQRAETVNSIETVAQTVKTLGTASADPRDHFRAAHATLVAAQLAVEDPKNKDPKRALSLLSDFETTVKGLPGEQTLLNDALFIRVSAFMDVGQLDQAVSTLLGLLNKAPNSAPGEVRELLEKLDDQYGRAELSNDTDTMRQIAINEAKLTGSLADWATNSTDPKIHKFAYSYQVYDANTKRKAGTLDTNPQQKARELQAAEETYKKLLSPENHQLYLNNLDPAIKQKPDFDPKQNDPAVEVGLAFTEYQLNQFADAQALLGELIGEGRLGSATVPVTDPDGQSRLKDNDIYWEANLTLIQCNAALAKAGGPDSAKIMNGAEESLKQFLVLGGIPARWQDAFERERKALIPDWEPPVISTQPSAQPPATPAANKPK